MMLEPCACSSTAQHASLSISRLPTQGGNRPYAPCGAWSDALHDHAGAPDGIAYRSRHDPDAICVALFERAGTALSVAGTTPLPAMLGAVAAVLDRYGKSVST